MGGSKLGGGSLFGEMHPTSWVIPAEMPVKTKRSKKTFKIGIPKESLFSENRVPLTPQSVSVLVANGHEIYVQKGAGDPSNYSDKDFSEAGAHICFTLADIYAKSEVVAKVAPLSREELDMLRPNTALLSAVNLGSLTPETLRVFIKKNIAAFGFEFLEDRDGNMPLVQMMSEIAGVSSIHIASQLLTVQNQGSGTLLGGISGVPPAVVTIIGAGTVGLHAARTALGMGATVKVIDQEVYALRRLEAALGVSVWTAVSQHHYIKEAVLSSDVVIGTAHVQGHRAPHVVTEDMVAEMKEGSVIVDVAIDQGGCIATSKLTNHDYPTFIKDGVIHYCVPNIAARVPATASAAISNVLTPLLIELGDLGGIAPLIKYNDGVKQGIYVYHKHLTKQSLGAIFGMESMDINLLVASDL